MTEATYGTQSEVKNQLGVDSTDTRFDTDIDNYLLKASRYMDNSLRKYTSAPVATNDTLDDIANDLATAYYREDKAGQRGEQVQMDSARRRAEAALKEYINTFYVTTTGDENRFFVEVVNE